MCGIVGAIASRDIVAVLTEGLKRLEYRGYDSAGIAVLDGGIRRVRRVGRVVEMENAARSENLKGIIGIALAPSAVIFGLWTAAALCSFLAWRQRAKLPEAGPNFPHSA